MKPFLKSEFAPRKGTQNPATKTKHKHMKLTEAQVNELIEEKKAWLAENAEEIAENAEAWSRIKEHDIMRSGDTGLWDELGDVCDYITGEQAERYTEEVWFEIYKIMAAAVRKSNPLLAAAFDATK